MEDGHLIHWTPLFAFFYKITTRAPLKRTPSKCAGSTKASTTGYVTMQGDGPPNHSCGTKQILPRLRVSNNKPQQEGITTKPGNKELFILILQKTSNNN